MKRHVIVGTGIRGIYEYAVPMERELADVTRLVGVYDINPKRAAIVSEAVGRDVPVYEDFDGMLRATRPDTVIVVTKDACHGEYVVRALDAGCDVVCEKPLTTDAHTLRAILEAKKRSGRKVLVTFNLRYLPFFARIKERLKDGWLGEVYNVHYEWKLDTVHGSSYFRRWHRERRNSGSLLIHKASHHFDLVNWFIDQEPAAVNAYGTRRFYGQGRAEHSVRCLDCPYKTKCAFYFDINADDRCRRLYLQCEDADGYLRDKCVFSDEIDIEDTVSISARYSGGAVMSYSLTAHAPYEGFRMYINGEKGRLEIRNEKRVREEMEAIFHNRFDERMDIVYPTEKMDRAGHGGADPRMREMIFRDITEDPLGQRADVRAGAMAIAIGIAANVSMAEQRAVSIDALFADMPW